MAPPRSPRAYRSRPSPRRVALRRALAAGFLALVFGVALWLGAGAFGEARGRARSRRRPRPPPPPPPKPLRIVFPEGFTRKQMAERVGAVRKIAQRKRKVTPRLTGASVPRRAKRAKLPAAVPRATRKRTSRASSSRRRTSSLRRRRRSSSSPTSSTSFAGNWGKVDLRYARSKNLTPYDVLIIASMIEKETIAPEERAKLVAAVIYNRLQAADAARDRRDAPLRARHPADRVDPAVAARERQPVQHAQPAGLPPTPIANPGLASMRAAAHPAKVDYLYFVAQAGQDAPLLHGERVRVLREGVRVRLRLRLMRDRRHDGTRRVCSGTRSRTRSRRGCRTRPSRRAGSTGTTRARRAAGAARGRRARARRARVRWART